MTRTCFLSLYSLLLISLLPACNFNPPTIGDTTLNNSICGDAVVESPETCDDGNTNGNDGCSSTCQIENGWTCQTPGQPCATVCGDGITAGNETCDDGNTNGNDGCSSTCQIENGWECQTPGQKCKPKEGWKCDTPNQPCTTVCGDGITAGTESCDDGNTNDGDGCSSKCLIENGWTCQNPGQSCAPICGDGIVAGDETCDDGNTEDNDGCSATCQLEKGWECQTPGQKCKVKKGWKCDTTNQHCTAAECGDGIVAGDETCDDGNTNNDDGCSSKCLIEKGWKCETPHQPCTPICGDGILAGKEECEDGNNISGDGCNAICSQETDWTCQPVNPTGKMITNVQGCIISGTYNLENSNQCDVHLETNEQTGATTLKLNDANSCTTDKNIFNQITKCLTPAINNSTTLRVETLKSPTNKSYTFNIPAEVISNNNIAGSKNTTTYATLLSVSFPRTEQTEEKTIEITTFENISNISAFFFFNGKIIETNGKKSTVASKPHNQGPTKFSFTFNNEFEDDEPSGLIHLTILFLYNFDSETQLNSPMIVEITDKVDIQPPYSSCKYTKN